MKLSGSRFKTNKRKYSVTKQIIKLWNSLPQDAMEAKNVNEFKKGLDKFMEDMCTDSYQKQWSRCILGLWKCLRYSLLEVEIKCKGKGYAILFLFLKLFP